MYTILLVVVVLVLVLCLAVLALAREVRFRRALQRLLQRLVVAWRRRNAADDRMQRNRQ